MIRRLLKTTFGFLAFLGTWGMMAGVVSCIAAMLLIHHFSQNLPDYSQLSTYDPPIVTRLYAADGKLMAEYATEKRIYVPLASIPHRLVLAFISAEDKNFYTHSGVDFTSIARAGLTNFRAFMQGSGSLVGGSTITQQVVKNFLLDSKQTFERKIKEAILATRITQAFSKERILELYLNDIYLGLGSYGVAAAALNYFNKSMDELTLEEVALLAALPKAPANYDPHRNYAEAKERRDWVLTRMQEDGYITIQEAETAREQPITLRARDAAETVRADFFSEEVRRRLSAMYGSQVLYQGGLVVHTTLNPKLQDAADHALRSALIDYDRRRGYRGPLAKLTLAADWKTQLAEWGRSARVPIYDTQRLGIVLAVDDKKARIGLEDGSEGTLALTSLGWAKPGLKRVSDLLGKGDVVLVAVEKAKADLQQIPAINGAMVVIDPESGRVLAMSGGYAYGKTEFNRATQARRQPGSAFKPFVYLAALESGYTPATIVLDAPVEQSQGQGLPMWRPDNYGNDYLGEATLRTGLEKSRNTMTVRIGQAIGIEKIIEVAKRFGIYDNPAPNFSMVLGALETTVLRLTNAYAMILNGGKRITPSLIERIDDRHGKTIFRRDARNCESCRLPFDAAESAWREMKPPTLEDDREQVADPRVAYQMVSMLQGVVQRGTAAAANKLGKTLAGKTGTTNDSMDTWFVGFSANMVAGVYIGYDQPKTLGTRETGGSVALPAFMEFMQAALKDTPDTPFRIPPGIELVRIDPATGDLAIPGEGTKSIQEAFVTGRPLFIPGVSPMPPGGFMDTDEHGNPIEHYAVDPDTYVIPQNDGSLRAIPNKAPAAGTGGLY